MQIYLIRHGKPQSGDDIADPPLAAIGRTQAEGVAETLRNAGIERIFSSPLRRAVETAEPLSRLLGLEIVTLDGLSEADRNGPRYHSIEYLRSDPNLWRQFMADPVRFLGSDPVQFRADVLEAFNTVFNCGVEKVAVFSHGLPINQILSHGLGLERITHFVPHYTSITRLAGRDTDRFSVVSVNETGHMQDAGPATREVAAS